MNLSLKTLLFINLTGNLTLDGNATIVAANLSIFAESLNVSSTAHINLTAMGFNSTMGPGTGTPGVTSIYSGGGAGHGGSGGDSYYNGVVYIGRGRDGGSAYGNYLAPIDFGSGGGLWIYYCLSGWNGWRSN